MKPSDAHALEAGQSAAGHINLNTIAAEGVVVGNRAADTPGRRGLRTRRPHSRRCGAIGTFARASWTGQGGFWGARHASTGWLLARGIKLTDLVGWRRPAGACAAA